MISKDLQEALQARESLQEDAPVRYLSRLEHTSLAIFSALVQNPVLSQVAIKSTEHAKSSIAKSVALARILLDECALKPQPEQTTVDSGGTGDTKDATT